MGDARSESERLPWLDPPRAKASHPRAKPPPKAARRARVPLFMLLSLFLVASIGMISYLVGRGSVAFSPESSASPPPTPSSQATVTLPPPPPPLPPALAMTEDGLAESPSPRDSAESPAESASARATRTTRAKAPSSSVRPAKVAPSPRAVEARRAIRQMPPLVRASPVVQLGAYPTRRQASAAFRRLTKVYPYLKKLPRDVRPIILSDNTRLYRLRMREYSPEYARILCGNLHSIGRGCAVLPVT